MDRREARPAVTEPAPPEGERRDARRPWVAPTFSTLKLTDTMGSIGPGVADVGICS
jgi:hypothetical protein